MHIFIILFSQIVAAILKKDTLGEMSSSEGVREHTVPLLLKGKGAITLTGDNHEVPFVFVFLPSGSVIKAW